MDPDVPATIFFDTGGKMPKIVSTLARSLGFKPKTISPITPWLIQRCIIDRNGKFSYDYMGSTEFEVGDQAKALKTLFSGEISLPQVWVQAEDGGAPVAVYLITQYGFDVAAYELYLQRLAAGKMQLKEATRFNHAVDFKATGKQPQFGCVSDYNIWFDFTESCDGQNIVLWTLNEQLRDVLLARLKVVTKAWAEKKD